MKNFSLRVDISLEVEIRAAITKLLVPKKKNLSWSVQISKERKSVISNSVQEHMIALLQNDPSIVPKELLQCLKIECTAKDILWLTG